MLFWVLCKQHQCAVTPQVGGRGLLEGDPPELFCHSLQWQSVRWHELVACQKPGSQEALLGTMTLLYSPHCAHLPAPQCVAKLLCIVQSEIVLWSLNICRSRCVCCLGELAASGHSAVAGADVVDIMAKQNVTGVMSDMHKDLKAACYLLLIPFAFCCVVCQHRSRAIR